VHWRVVPTDDEAFALARFCRDPDRRLRRDGSFLLILSAAAVARRNYGECARSGPRLREPAGRREHARADVESWVDVPYRESEIVESRGLRLGPHLAPLTPFANKIAILNGVDVSTANHHTGQKQYRTFKTNTFPQMPSLFQLIGAQKTSQAIDASPGSIKARNLQRSFRRLRPTN
jgi:hypothetical protein